MKKKPVKKVIKKKKVKAVAKKVLPKSTLVEKKDVKVRKKPAKHSPLYKKFLDVHEANEKNRKKDKLSARRELFCQEYIKDGNGAMACVRAGYSKRGARVQGAILLTNPLVRMRVEELLAECKEVAIVERETVLQVLSQQITSKLSDYIEETGSLNIKKISEAGSDLVNYTVSDNAFGQTKSIKLADAQGAIDKLCRMKGWYAPVKSFVRGDITTKQEEPKKDLSKLSTEELRTLLKLQEKIEVEEIDNGKGSK